MRPDSLSRRSLLTVTAGCALTGAGVASVVGDTAQSEEDADESGVTRESFVIREGTDEETTVYVTTADADGPTAVVVGGMHGNEIAGYTAAERIADWTIDAGTLVAIPEANAVAIERGTRNDDEGNNLNRQFTAGGQPETELAQEIWAVISDYDPDVVVDLHESTGIYAGDPMDGVGQAIFHSADQAAVDAAADAADYVTRNYVDDPDLAFEIGPFSAPGTDPDGLLVHKAARELGAEAYLAETLSTDIELGTRVQWHSAIVDRLFQDDLLLNEPAEGTAPDEPADDESDESEAPAEDEGEDEAESGDGGEEADREPPVAEISTDPARAGERVLEPGQTVTLDASGSTAPDGEIVRYEWRVGDGPFDETGETIDVTVSAKGDHPVALRVVDDADRTDTITLTLSADC
ncbi:PKD domain-containing protein [Natrinema salifodinae]|uniref:PKD domain-containing protein n=1 Tax=Natrinema salifodinae TaxID=1202768 RepID=A0A1I0NCZ9_9EURY|nr:PKD domain-containing protein [Natrinema salifodinae]SEV98962.1 PKD domain-containing protein [Natrinema salifodinae]